jgi:dTDP-glucose 4,6-dehydratase
MGKGYLLSAPWHNTSMRKLITGGAGFIGSNYLRKYVPEEKDIEFVVVDALTYAGKLDNLIELLDLPNFSFHHGDIADKQFMQKLIKQGDTLINFAAESHVDRSINSGYEFVKTNVLGAQVLLDLSVKAGDVNFIQISTDEVYGSIDEGSWDESYPLKPNSPYSASKAASDLLCLSYFKTFGLNLKITRCCNNYGPFQFPEKLIPFFVKRLLEGQKVPVYGTGENIREWIHVDDHVEGIRLVEEKGKCGEIYNLGSGDHFTNLDIARLILELLGYGSELIEYVTDRKGHDLRYSLNTSKAREELGFETKVNFSEGIIRTINWYKENPTALSNQHD